MRGPIELLQESLSMLKNHWKLFFSIFLVPGILMSIINAVLEHPNSVDDGFPFGWGLTLINFVISLVVSLALLKAISSPENTNVSSAFRFARDNFKQYFLVAIFGILASVLSLGPAIAGVLITKAAFPEEYKTPIAQDPVTSLGFLALLGLLTIPAIIVSVWFSFAQFLVLFEDKRGLKALIASKELVKNNWWKTFGRIVSLFIFIIIIVMILSSIGSFILGILLPFFLAVPALLEIGGFILGAIVIPFALIYFYFMYLDLKAQKNVQISGVPASTAHEASI